MRMHSKNSKRYSEVNKLVWYKVVKDMLRWAPPFRDNRHITSAFCDRVATEVNQAATDVYVPIRRLVKIEVQEGRDNGENK